MILSARIYNVRGTGPAGTQIEASVVADSAVEARKKAHEAGLTRIVIGPYRESDDTPPPAPTAPTR